MIPRYVRFARCLALVSGLGACASTPATTTSTTTTTASTTRPVTSSGSTMNRPTAGAMCDCSCGGATHEQPDCYSVGMADCCSDMIIEGPLPPPDLAV
jgi:hypothetical protein